MITRRKILIALGAGAFSAPFPSIAQSQGKIWRIGILASTGRPAPSADAFLEGMRDLGYVEGKNITIEARYADGDLARLPALAAELVQHKVDLIFAPNSPTVQAAKQATTTIPIVFATVADPVFSGFVASLARPAGNITGLTIISADVSAKRLQLLKEALPKILRVAIFRSTGISALGELQVAEIQRAAKSLRMETMSTQLERREDFKPQHALLRKWRADSMYIVESPVNNFNRKLLADFAVEARLPMVCAEKGYAEAGALMSYGANYQALSRRAATYADKILKGAKPGDLPVEQPTIFELAINMKTAKLLGIKIPQLILGRADAVIQ